MAAEQATLTAVKPTPTGMQWTAQRDAQAWEAGVLAGIMYAAGSLNVAGLLGQQ